jgi:hypothetical protein
MAVDYWRHAASISVLVAAFPFLSSTNITTTK